MHHGWHVLERGHSTVGVGGPRNRFREVSYNVIDSSLGRTKPLHFLSDTFRRNGIQFISDSATAESTQKIMKIIRKYITLDCAISQSKKETIESHCDIGCVDIP